MEGSDLGGEKGEDSYNCYNLRAKFHMCNMSIVHWSRLQSLHITTVLARTHTFLYKNPLVTNAIESKLQLFKSVKSMSRWMHPTLPTQWLELRWDNFQTFGCLDSSKGTLRQQFPTYFSTCMFQHVHTLLTTSSLPVWEGERGRFPVFYSPS